MNKTINVYDLENDTATGQYSFEESIAVNIFPELIIKISDLFSKKNLFTRYKKLQEKDREQLSKIKIL